MKTAHHIRIDGSIQEVKPKAKKFSLEELQGFVGGYIEQVKLPGGRTMWVNEEGLIHGLPLNHEASKLAGHPIVGDVLLEGRG